MTSGSTHPEYSSPSPFHRVNLRDLILMMGFRLHRHRSLHPLFIGSTFGTVERIPLSLLESVSPSPLHRVNLRDDRNDGSDDSPSNEVSILSSSGQPSGPGGTPFSGAPFGGLHPLFIASTFGTRYRELEQTYFPVSPSPFHRVNLRDGWEVLPNGGAYGCLHPLFIGSTFGTLAPVIERRRLYVSPSPLDRVNLRDLPAVHWAGQAAQTSPSPLHRVNLRDQAYWQALVWGALWGSPSPLHRVNLRDRNGGT